jgi:hypothetical protein
MAFWGAHMADNWVCQSWMDFVNGSGHTSYDGRLLQAYVELASAPSRMLAVVLGSEFLQMPRYDEMNVLFIFQDLLLLLYAGA